MDKSDNKKRYIVVAHFIVLIIMEISFSSLNLFSSSFDYSVAWKEVERIAYSTPKTAIEKIDNINQHAKKEKNDIQRLRCIIEKGNLGEFIEEGAFKKSLAEIEVFSKEVKDPVTKAVTDYLLGKAYLNFYDNNRWVIDDRTNLADTIPEDIEEWTKNLIFQKIRDLQTSAVQVPEVKTTKAVKFMCLFEFGKDDAKYRPMLYDLLLNDMMSEHDVWTVAERMDMRQRLVDFHRSDADRSAYTQAKIDWIAEKYDQKRERDSVILSLEELLEEVKNEEVSMIVRAELCKNFMKEESYDSEWTKCANNLRDELPLKVMKLAKDGIDAYPQHPATPYLKSVIDRVKQQKVSVVLLNERVQTGDTLTFRVTYANITDLTLILCRYDGDYWSLAQKNDWSKGQYCKEVARYSFQLEKTNYFIEKDTVISISKSINEYGYYAVKTNLEEKNKFNGVEFSVTDLYCLAVQRTSKKYDYVVVNAKNGEALQGVELESHYNSFGKESESNSSTKTDKTGEDGFAEVKYEKKGCYKTVFKNGKDVFHSVKTVNVYGDREVDNSLHRWNNAGEVGEIFVDRAIYRPGQVVHFKVILYERSEDSSSILSDAKVNVVLKDFNGTEIGKKELKTNEFGSAASSFVLPENLLAGSFSLVVNNKYVKKIQLEEYKRPTFEILFEKPSDTYMYGDSITIKGKVNYLMGASVSNAKVACKVVRTPFRRYYMYGPEAETIAESEMNTDKEGGFSVSFRAEKGKEENCFKYKYTISVEVTDSNGETQESETDMYVGDYSILFSLDLGESLTFDKFVDFRFRVTKIDASGLSNHKVDYEVKKDNKSLAFGSQMSDNDGYFLLPVETSKWESGRYEIVLKAKDEKGREAVDTLKTVLFRLEDKCPPVYSLLWTDGVQDVSLSEGEGYTVRVGSSLEDAHLLVIITDEKSKSTRHWYDLSNEIKEFKFALEDSRKEAMNIEFYLVHEGKLNSQRMVISQKEKLKELPVSLSVFRDKVKPGSKESWTITVPKEYDAEILAAMYDASLDKFSKLEWFFSPEYRKFVSFLNWEDIPNRMDKNMYYENAVNQRDFYLSFGQWIRMMQGGLGRGRRYGMGVGNCCILATAEVESVKMESEDRDVLKSKRAMPKRQNSIVSVDESLVASNGINNDESEDTEKGDIPFDVRSNFQETAFFYPQLRTDSMGKTTINFEMPESLTRWNFLVFGHTRDLRHGMIEKQIVTQKDFTVSPNLPRFFRKNDKMTLTAKVVNLSDVEQNGEVVIQFLDPVTEEVIAKRSVDFSVSERENSAVKVDFEIPENYDALLVRTIAKTKKFSDAEQKLVPVLSDRTIVTQSMPIYVRGGQTKKYTFKNLAENTSNTLRTNFLKLEFSNNPIWYAVQALPTIVDVEHKNANSLSAAHFATVLSSHIAKSNPKIFNVINAWKNQGGDAKTLLSHLEKNPEVKSVLLSETPWVMEAKNETEMKQRLSTLFDLNVLNEKSEKWLNELKQYQCENGGYRWLEGMSPNMHTTLFILDNLGRLKQAGVLKVDGSLNESIEKALKYLDTKIEEEYERKIQWDVNWKKHATIGIYELYYFQVRSMFSETKNFAVNGEAYKFYYGLMKKQWAGLSLLGKSLAATALYRGGDKEIAKKIVNSLREYSTLSDEMGMYWVKNVNGYLWQDAAVSTHTRIMEALALVDYNKEEQDNLRLWLLNQKRTQNWDNVIANVDALNVLLLSGSDWVQKENDVLISVGGDVVKTENAEVGTGYLTKVYSEESVSSKLADVQLTSSKGGNISWGAMYWQFEENYDKVQKSKNALHIERQIMLQQENNGQTVLKKIDPKMNLKVGDKLVVRITLRVDRDMDYVVLKDQRASCLEPTTQKSGYRCEDGICFYMSPKDAAMYYYFEHLSKGTFVFEYPSWVTHAGDFTTGLATVQCLYASEFLSNSASEKIHIVK